MSMCTYAVKNKFELIRVNVCLKQEGGEGEKKTESELKDKKDIYFLIGLYC